MSVLVVPDPFGVGSVYVESIVSVVKRTAKLYQVSNARMLRLVLAAVGVKSPNQMYTRVSSWLGGAKLSANLVEGIRVWSGKDLGSVALAKQRSVLNSGRFLLAEHARVCPACAHDQTGSDYEMLCHQMKYVSHCPLHECLLNESCLACGKFVGCYQWLAKGARCTSCKSDFGSQYREQTHESNFERWCEVQAMKFVEYTTSSEFDSDRSGWVDRFRSGLSKLSGSTMEGYSRNERDFVRQDFSNKGLPFSKLLKVASMQACGVVDLIRAPEEMLSPRLAVSGGIPTPKIRRVVIDPGLLEQVERHLQELLATDENVKLPTKRAVFREFGVECNRVWRMYPHLSAVYSAELARRRRVQMAAAMGRVVLEARTFVEVMAHFEVHASNLALRDAIRDECGVSRAVAWQGMRIALAEASFDIRYRDRRERSRASVSSSELSGLREGYVNSR